MKGKERLKLLLTNDDGFDAEGIRVLSKTLEEKADVYVLAPDRNRSGVSSHIVLAESLYFTRHAENRYSCTGYPADCVISALRSNLFSDVKFDAVIAGINKGPNMGTDCIYSGTIAAARQAVLYGIPGIALSLTSPEGEYAPSGYDYQGLSDFVKDNIEKLISLYENDCIISINAMSIKKYKGVRYTALCFRDYKDKIVFEVQDNDSLKSSFLSGSLTTTGPLGNEYEAVSQGYIALTRLHAEPVDFRGAGFPAEDFKV